MNILANDGLSAQGISLLEDSGFKVITTRVAQEQLAAFLNTNDIKVLLVRSATKVRQELMDAAPGLKLIGRAGVGMDNIDVAYARKKGIRVINTPESSSDSVAELAMAHLFAGARSLHDSNRTMPLEGDQHFKALKKSYSNGRELAGKTLGIVGFGRIGQATARMAIGLGMEVIYHDHSSAACTIALSFYDGRTLEFPLQSSDLDTVYKRSDFITFHVPAQDDYLVGEAELARMKPGVGLVNTARGGVIDEVALVAALESGQVAFAGLDVFENEPKPEIQLLMHPGISLSPHIGAATREAQDRIGLELARQIIEILD